MPLIVVFLTLSYLAQSASADPMPSYEKTNIPAVDDLVRAKYTGKATRELAVNAFLALNGPAKPEFPGAICNFRTGHFGMSFFGAGTFEVREIGDENNPVFGVALSSGTQKVIVQWSPIPGRPPVPDRAYVTVRVAKSLITERGIRKGMQIAWIGRATIHAGRSPESFLWLDVLPIYVFTDHPFPWEEAAAQPSSQPTTTPTTSPAASAAPPMHPPQSPYQLAQLCLLILAAIAALVRLLKPRRNAEVRRQTPTHHLMTHP